jgi:NAD dependent epimerase/dehydratase family enzyme
MADSLLLSGQRAVPARASQLGFKFTYPSLSLALDAVLHHGAGVASGL